jgi:hypothetical protein
MCIPGVMEVHVINVITNNKNNSYLWYKWVIFKILPTRGICNLRGLARVGYYLEGVTKILQMKVILEKLCCKAYMYLSNLWKFTVQKKESASDTGQRCVPV